MRSLWVLVTLGRPDCCHAGGCQSRLLAPAQIRVGDAAAGYSSSLARGLATQLKPQASSSTELWCLPLAVGRV
eukprot:2884822-Rhodomonas_salina.2